MSVVGLNGYTLNSDLSELVKTAGVMSRFVLHNLDR
jgi:hypothetical protein